MYMYRRRDENALGAGLLGLAVGALLGVLFAPKSGRETRGDVSNWMQDMSEELNYRIKNMRDLTVDRYNQTVDEVARKYRNTRRIKDSELDDFVNDLKMRWDRIKDQWNE